MPNSLNIIISYVDEHLKVSKRFGLQKLIEKDPAWETHLQFWTPKLCYKNPHLFHLIITVSLYKSITPSID
jgi:hypothetical protein